MKTLRWLAAGAVAAMIATTSFAQTTTQKNEPPPGSAQRDVENANALHLSLDQAIDSAISANLGVQIQRFDYRESGYSARATYGAFDWLTFADLERASQKQPVSAVIIAPQSDRTVANFGVQQYIPTGGTYSIGFDNSRQSSNSPFTSVNPAYQSSLGFSLTQPLLRNFGTDVSLRSVRIARNNLGINEEAFRDALIQTALSVEQAYLDLIYARQNLEVLQQSLFLAKDQERITQIRIDVGASAPLDILQPRVAISTRDEEVIAGEAAVRAAEDRLRALMNLPYPEWDRPILPTDNVSYTPVAIDMNAAVQEAMDRRPEIREARLGIANSQIQYVYARNQVLPKVDLGASYGLAGLGGTRPITDSEGHVIGYDRTNIGTAYSQIGGFDFPSWTFSLNVGVPVRNIGARSEAKRAQLEISRQSTNEEQLRQSIAVEVRQTARDVDTAAKEIVATRAARDAAEKNLGAERKRFENGMTTNFNILLIQQDLSDARSREIQALVAYNKALANYHRAIGDLLEVRNITVELPEKFDLPKSRLEGIPWLESAHYHK